MGNAGSGLSPPAGSTLASSEPDISDSLVAVQVGCDHTEASVPQQTSSRRNSLDAAILAAFENVNSEDHVDPKFLHSVDALGHEECSRHRRWPKDDEDFENSELPPDSWNL